MVLRLKEFGYDVFVVDWNFVLVEKVGEFGINVVWDDFFSLNLEFYCGVKVLYLV